MKTKSTIPVKTLSKKAQESLAELQGLIASTPVMSWMLSHGFVRPSFKAKALTSVFPKLSGEELKKQVGICTHALSIAYDRGLMEGTLSGVRGYSSGNVVGSIEGTAMGKVMADAMAKCIADAQASITKGEFPVMLTMPCQSKKDKEVSFKLPGTDVDWKLDYRLAKAALGMSKASSEEVLTQLTETLAAAKEVGADTIVKFDASAPAPAKQKKAA